MVVLSKKHQQRIESTRDSVEKLVMHYERSSPNPRGSADQLRSWNSLQYIPLEERRLSMVQRPLDKECARIPEVENESLSELSE